MPVHKYMTILSVRADRVVSNLSILVSITDPYVSLSNEINGLWVTPYKYFFITLQSYINKEKVDCGTHNCVLAIDFDNKQPIHKTYERFL